MSTLVTYIEMISVRRPVQRQFAFSFIKPPFFFSGEIKCNQTIPHGLVDTRDCYGCPYTCDYGYDKNVKVSMVSCSGHGNWAAYYLIQAFDSVNDLCIRMYAFFILCCL